MRATQVSGVLLVLALIPFAGGGHCQHAGGGSGSEQFIGTWAGTGTQTGGITWPMNVSLQSTQPGSQCATIEYPSIPCVGYWLCDSYDGVTLRGREFITSGRCVPGTVAVAVTPNGELDVSGTGQGVESRAILSRR